MSKVIQFKPEPKQFIAWSYLTDNITNEILFGGGARGGKSWLGCSWIIINCLQYPGSAWLIGRKELSRLLSTTFVTFLKVATLFDLKIDVHFKFNAQRNIISFVNGSTVYLVDLKYNPSDPEFDRLGSYDLTGCFLDESQEVHVKAINVLRGRFSLLEGNGWSTIPKALYTCNPAKNWIYLDFYKPWKEKRLDASRIFIPSLVTDNKKYVKQEYIDNLKRSDKVTVERLLHGNFEYDDDPGVLMGYDTISDLFTNKTEQKEYDWYVSVDVAREGKDSTVIMIWNTLQVKEIRKYSKKKTNETALILSQIENEYSIPRSHFIIDEDGVGGGVVDQFQGAKGFVNNSSAILPYSPNKTANYQNLKTQCYFMLAEYVNTWRVGIDTTNPEYRDALVEELEQVKRVDIDKDGKLKIQSKEDVKEKLGRSPDFSDALMMRMFFEINKAVKQKPKKRPPQYSFNRITGEKILLP